MIIAPLVAPSFHTIAPPFIPAVLFSKREFINVLLSHTQTFRTLRKNIAPPLPVALLSTKLQLSTVPSDPTHKIAPPLPESPLTDTAVPLA